MVPHLQVPGLPHVLPKHVVSQVVKHSSPHWCVWGAVAWLLQDAHQPVCVFAVELAELCRPAVILPSCDAVSPVELLLYGVVVEVQVPHHRQDVAAQVADALPQQEQAVGHPGQLQLLLGLGAADAAIEERQVGRRVLGHGETWRTGSGLWLEGTRRNREGKHWRNWRWFLKRWNLSNI